MASRKVQTIKILLVLGMFYSSDARVNQVRKELKKMRSTLDIVLLDSVDFRREIQALWEVVNKTDSAQAMAGGRFTNTSCICEETTIKDVLGKLSETGAIPSNDLDKFVSELKMIRRGFKDEKVATRAVLGKAMGNLRLTNAHMQQMKKKLVMLNEECTIVLPEAVDSVKKQVNAVKEAQAESIRDVGEAVENSIAWVRDKAMNDTLELSTAMSVLKSEMIVNTPELRRLVNDQSEINAVLQQQMQELKSEIQNLRGENLDLKTTVSLVKQIVDLDGWVPFKNSIYKLFKEPSRWEDAVNTCSRISRKANLAEVTSREENNFIATQLGLSDKAWLGGTDIQNEGTWKWRSGLDIGTRHYMYDNFRRGEPNDADSGEDCLSIDISSDWNGQWNDAPCSAKQHFVCEIHV